MTQYVCGWRVRDEGSMIKKKKSLWGGVIVSTDALSRKEAISDPSVPSRFYVAEGYTGAICSAAWVFWEL